MKIIAFRFRVITLVIAFISVFTACHQKNNRSTSGTSPATSRSAGDSFKARLMAVHEEAMGKIAPLRRVEDSLRKEINSGTAGNRDTVELSGVATALDRCDTAMFGWMGRYHDQMMSPDSSNPALIKKQLQSLELLNDSMDRVIKKGRFLLH